MSRRRWCRVAAAALAVLGVCLAGCSRDLSTVTPSAVASPYPDGTNTGVRDRSTLSTYTGSCALDQPGTVIENQAITCDRLVILAKGVTIRSSTVSGWIDLSVESASLVIEDSVVDAGDAQAPAIGFYNLTVERTEVIGGQTSVQCASNCVIEDSWLHDQRKPKGAEHLGGYLSNGGSNVVLRHNTIACTPEDNAAGGGCTGSMQIFGDFAELNDFRFENNLVKATPGGYCASFGYNPGARHGTNPSGIVVIGNVFERGPTGRCGVWGAATSFLETGQGNVWQDNSWDDGQPLQPNT